MHAERHGASRARQTGKNGLIEESVATLHRCFLSQRNAQSGMVKGNDGAGNWHNSGYVGRQYADMVDLKRGLATRRAGPFRGSGRAAFTAGLTVLVAAIGLVCRLIRRRAAMMVVRVSRLKRGGDFGGSRAQTRDAAQGHRPNDDLNDQLSRIDHVG